MNLTLFMKSIKRMKQIYSSTLLLAIVFFLGCTAAIKNNSAVFDYAEFGPQVVSHELLGKEWYQWDPHGSSDPNERYDIKVVVYRDMPLKKIQQQYPVIKGEKDYRYLEYSLALQHLDTIAKEPILSEDAATTKAKILAALGH
jgi:hypothetical protein